MLLSSEFVQRCSSSTESASTAENAKASPALKTTSSNDEKVTKLVQRMSARHLELIRELSAKNREKEEQLKKDEQRQRKRESSLRTRILARMGDDDEKLDKADYPSLPPDETASADERRLWKLKCNMDIERRQQEAIQRLQEFQRVKSLKLEREQLKRQWRAHRAKSYLLEQCQNTDLKEYLESKEKPRALPRLPPREASLSATRVASKRTESESEVDRDASPTPPETPRNTVTLMEREEDMEEMDQLCEASPSTSSMVASPLGPKVAARADVISRFVRRMRSAQIALKTARHLSDWKRLNCCPQSTSVFICAGGYPDFTKAMVARGWFQNEDKESRFFDLKWAPASAIDHDHLLPNQAVNHFHGNREITTKVGLTLNLRSCLPLCSADPDSFYPRAYDLYDPLERADFALNFKFTKAQAILREFIRNIDSQAAMTFSSDVVSTAFKICLRLVTDPAEIMDCPQLAEALAMVSAEEWSLLEQAKTQDAHQSSRVSRESFESPMNFHYM
ncbi:unnamed protein product [Durusdinium trenchii]|uniref:Uncharacterized protein n=1 Tax=Durusdinium trenchii TaxID=1381693 RepID=A0ABP0HF88_9DINO